MFDLYARYKNDAVIFIIKSLSQFMNTVLAMEFNTLKIMSYTYT